MVYEDTENFTPKYANPGTPSSIKPSTSSSVLGHRQLYTLDQVHGISQQYYDRWVQYHILRAL
jgi:hypothetical protein